MTQYFSYSYDAAGNRTQEDKHGQPAYYYCDEANQLTHRNAPSEGSDRWTYYAYDENGSLLRGIPGIPGFRDSGDSH